MVIQKVEHAQWQSVESISGTQRNEGGFGSTGKN